MRTQSAMALDRARALIGKKTAGGVEFVALVLRRNGTVEGVEALCPCGTVWTVRVSKVYAGEPVRSCLACMRKRQRVHNYLSAREERAQ